MKGSSRVDQSTKLLNGRVHGGTHAWFVRVYEGKLPRLARTFSDKAAGGQLAALKAALAAGAARIGSDNMIDSGTSQSEKAFCDVKAVRLMNYARLADQFHVSRSAICRHVRRL